MYFLLTGVLPFDAETPEKTVEKINECRLDFNIKKNRITEDAKDLISRMLTVDPALRISAKDALGHRWLLKKFRRRRKTLDPGFYEGLKKYNVSDMQAANKIATSILLFISNYMLTSSEESKLANMFKESDYENNGKLSREKIRDVLSSSVSLDHIEFDEIFDNLDVCKSGFLNYSDFLSISLTINGTGNRGKIEMICKYFEDQNKGCILVKDLQNRFTNIGKVEWDMFLSGVKSNDGQIDVNDFKNYLFTLFGI